MTNEWLDRLYHQAGVDMHHARIEKLLEEFRCLSNREKTHPQETPPGAAAIGHETTGDF